MPGATEDAIVERLFSYYGPQEGDKKSRWHPRRAAPLLPFQRTHLYGPSGTAWACLLRPLASLGLFPGDLNLASPPQAKAPSCTAANPTISSWATAMAPTG